MTTLIEIDSAATGYRKILDTIITAGEDVSPRGLSCRELRNVAIELKNPAQNLTTGVGRKMNTRIAAAEALQLVAGVQYPGLMSSISNGKFDEFLDGGAFHGAYGPRIASQMQPMIDRLETDRSTRRAVVSIWNPSLDTFTEGLHDYPCTISLNFHIRKNFIHMTTHMRSNDAWLGWPYDVFQFTELQQTISNITGFYLGTYTHLVDSMHLYQPNLQMVDAIKTEPKDEPDQPGGIWNAITWNEAAYSAASLIHGNDPVDDKDDESSLNYEWYLAQANHHSWSLR